MTDIPWPAHIVPDESQFYLRSNTRRGISPYTRTQQVEVRGRAIWTCQMSFTRFMDETGEFDALVAALEGGAIRVLVPDFRRRQPWGTGRTAQDLLETGGFPQPWSDGTFFSDGTGLTVEGGPPRLTTAAEAGDTVIVTDGWWDGDAVLEPGDYLQIGAEFNMVAYGATIATDFAGRATIPLSRGLLYDHAAGAAIMTEDARCLMRLAGDDAGQNQTRNPVISDYTLSLIEDLPWLGVLP